MGLVLFTGELLGFGTGVGLVWFGTFGVGILGNNLLLMSFRCPVCQI